MKTLNGRVAVVTGAASGIGRSLAEQLTQAGCRVALVDVHQERLAEVHGACADSSMHVVDVSDRAAMLALPDAVIEAHGAVHIVINNAGVSCNRMFDEHTLEDWDWLLGINLYGVLHGCHAFLPHLMTVDEAHIVNVSSVFGIVGLPAQSSYCASKFAVRGLTESLWEELEHTHVGVTVVHPGGVDTNIVRDGRNPDGVDEERLFRRFAKQAIPASEAARQIVVAIRNDEKRLRITKEAYFMDWAKRLMPVWGNRLVARGLIKALGLTEMEQKRIGDYQATRR
ncbi:MAG: SDR family oxidoreductase [Proteobacteria bacterium]|nr:SDR family oxidoreductase [Pseudomonadota bacterium]MCP4921189.1 SDR family oxidoreductase [Pseudomonadota bacterium]